MARAEHSYPGRDPDAIFARLRSQLWDRRREISSHELIDDLLRAVRWDADARTAGGTKRVMLLRCSVALEVRGERATVDLRVPVRKYERKYAARVQPILETLFDDA